MKKLILAIAILFSLSSQAQDTTYVMKRAKLYMVMRQEVTSPDARQAFDLAQRKKKRRNDTIFTIVVGVIFGGISTWYWSK